MILECAVESKAEYIITGDDDLLRIKEFKGIKIVTTDKFLKEN
jgi:predicted nucleic acid-binding protein